MTHSHPAAPARVGLLSLPRYFNYGTHLQLYALQTAIVRHGYACEVLDYDPSFEHPPQQLVQRVSSMLKEPARLIHGVRERTQAARLDKLAEPRVRRFQQFLDERIMLGARRYGSFEELEQHPPTCAGYVVGSDQVWNPIGHYGDRAYFLSFAEESKRAAYAPSIGVSEVAPEHEDWLCTGLAGMTHLSVREQRGAEIIRALSGREAQVVLDPTLLLTAEDWSRIAAPVERTRPYVLLYALQADAYVRTRAAELATHLGADLVVLPWHRCDALGRTTMKRVFDAGPEQYIGLFKNAAAVCTDSFHGSVFSVIFRRPFFSFRRYENAVEASFHSRITNLLTITGLQSREMHAERPMPKDPMEVDFDAAHAAIIDHRIHSQQYLAAALAAMIETHPR